MKLVVGLGNPGRKYEKTRHNIGFELINELARRHGSGLPKGKFQGEVIDASIGGEKVLLLKPHTYMNLSGNSIQPAMDFFKLELEDLLVVCDDFNLTLASLRFRAKGSAGGQKGLADTIRRLGSQEFTRLRVGIGPLPEHYDVSDFVLSKYSPEDRADIEQTILRAADAVADWIGKGVDFCMNRYN
jgi:PTH1 family peptidyl-tRNA hydrolase